MIATRVASDAVAVMVKRPRNPSSTVEFRSDIVVEKGGEIRALQPESLQQGIEAARMFVPSAGTAIGVFQSEAGAFHLAKLQQRVDGKLSPLVIDIARRGPIGGPRLDRFEITAYGAGVTDSPALQAIVGATRYASFEGGKVAFPEGHSDHISL